MNDQQDIEIGFEDGQLQDGFGENIPFDNDMLNPLNMIQKVDGDFKNSKLFFKGKTLQFEKKNELGLDLFKL